MGGGDMKRVGNAGILAGINEPSGTILLPYHAESTRVSELRPPRAWCSCFINATSNFYGSAFHEKIHDIEEDGPHISQPSGSRMDGDVPRLPQIS